MSNGKYKFKKNLAKFSNITVNFMISAHTYKEHKKSILPG